MNISKRFNVVLFTTIMIILLAVGYIVIYYKYEDYLLNKEINSIKSISDINDNYVTKGKFKVVEKAIKDYLKDYYNCFNDLNNVTHTEEFNNLLSYNNLSEDVDFNNSKKYISNTKQIINKDIDTFITLGDKDYIKNYIFDYNLDKYFVDRYNKLLLNNKNLTKYIIDSNSLENYRNSINTKLDTTNDIYDFLNNNKDNYVLEDNQLKLKTNELISQYNSFIEKIRA